MCVGLIPNQWESIPATKLPYLECTNQDETAVGQWSITDMVKKCDPSTLIQEINFHDSLATARQKCTE